MNKKRKGGLGRWLLMILEEISIVVLAICLTVTVNYLVVNNGNLNWGDESTFEESSSFNELFSQKETDVLNFVELSNIFETGGKFDGDKIIDIQQFVENNIATGEETTSVGYRLDDLLRWGQSGIFYKDVTGETTYINPDNTINPYDTDPDGSGGGLTPSDIEVTAIPLDEEGKETDGADTAAVQGEGMDESQNAQGLQGARITPGTEVEKYSVESVDLDSRLTEEYLPADGRSFYEHFPNPQEWENMYRYLENAAEALSNEFLAYKQYSAKMKPDKTNMRYYIRDYEHDAVYSNLDALGPVNESEGETGPDQENERALGFLTTMGPYILVDSISTNCQTSMKMEDYLLFQKLTNYSDIFEGDYYVVMAVDTDYPVEDVFVSERGPYYQMQPWIRWTAAGGVAAAALSFILLIMLTCMAGRVKGEDKIRLTRFDRIKTEPAALLVILAGYALILMAVFGLSRYLMSTWVMYAWVGVFAGLLNMVFLFGYLSLIRRIKAETLWKNSVLNRLWRLLKDLTGNIHTHVKFVVMFLVYIIVSLILIPFSLILWLMFTLVVGVMLLNESVARNKVIEGIRRIAEEDTDYQIDTKNLTGDNLLLAQEVNNIGKGIRAAIDMNVKNERLKSDLITNVSHDIKTPLTSIINYVDLLKRENIKDSRIKSYIDVLDNKSQRLKQLTEDLVEASKISSGNITYSITRLDFKELIYQTSGEFDEKFREKGLELILSMPEESVVVEADGRRLWRVLENIYNNVAKYAMENTRVYADLKPSGEDVEFSLKNISKQALNIDADELTERFIRGDVSRSTEGSGLGLSIAKNLTEAQNGKFDIYLDGDLFRVTIHFPGAPEAPNPNKDGGDYGSGAEGDATAFAGADGRDTDIQRADHKDSGKSAALPGENEDTADQKPRNGEACPEERTDAAPTPLTRQDGEEAGAD